MQLGPKSWAAPTVLRPRMVSGFQFLVREATRIQSCDLSDLCLFFLKTLRSSTKNSHPCRILMHGPPRNDAGSERLPYLYHMHPRLQLPHAKTAVTSKVSLLLLRRITTATTATIMFAADVAGFCSSFRNLPKAKVYELSCHVDVWALLLRFCLLFSLVLRVATFTSMKHLLSFLMLLGQHNIT